MRARNSATSRLARQASITRPLPPPIRRGIMGRMRDRIILVTILVLVFAGSAAVQAAAGRWRTTSANGRAIESADRFACPQPHRDAVCPGAWATAWWVVSRFCRYPAAGRRTAQNRRLYGPELRGHRRPAARLDRDARRTRAIGAGPSRSSGCGTLTVRHKDIDGILASIPTIGRACGAEAKAEELVTNIRRRLERVRQKTAELPRPRVMVAVNRALGSGRLDDVYVAAEDGHLGRIVEFGRRPERLPAERGPISPRFPAKAFCT